MRVPKPSIMHARAPKPGPVKPTGRYVAAGWPRPAGLGLARLVRVLALAAAWGALVPAASAQITNSYVDDSVLARESLSRADDLIAAGNLNEAARVIQGILDTETDRVIESATDRGLFLGVRDVVHTALLDRPEVLERYRRREDPVAEAMMREGRTEEVERSRLLTRWGFEAALRLAQEHYESARFEAARLTLEQLERHPDRGDRRLSEAAADAACRVARYLPRERVQSMARRWCAEAGLAEPDLRPVAWPDRWSESMGRDSSSPGPEPALDRLVEGPLQSVFLSRDASVEFRAFQELPADENLTSRILSWTFPTVVGDDVIVNDGRSLTAFDRYTLAARWRRDFSLSATDATFDTPRDAIRTIHSAVRVEDAATVRAAEGVAVAAMGLLSQQLREGDNRLRAVEVSTGRDLWARTPGEIADTLRLAEFRGPPLIDQSVAIQSFRKESAARRLGSTYLAGVDLWTGRTRWVRLIGSAGTLGSFGTRPGETPVAHEGVVYRADDSGLISAIESVSGRVRWIRVIRNDLLMRASESSPPWASQAPVIDELTLIVLDPSQRTIHRFSLDQGTLVASRDTSGIPLPIHYLLAAGEPGNRALVCVSESQMAVLPMTTFHVARPVLVPRVIEPGFRGRVVAMGDVLAAPIHGGVLLVPVSDAANPSVRPLDHTGNIVASGSNLLVADAWRLHSYLAWDDADRLLSARIQADPSDPRPALALCELAYRAGRFDRIVVAADQALSAMARDPRSPVAQQVRPRLFESLLDMVRSSTRAGAQAPAASVSPRIEDLALVDGLVSRLERLADSPAETVQWLLSLGSLRELQSKPVDACRAYQRILEDQRLAAVPWRGESPPVQGSTLAVSRLRAVLLSFGPSAYEPFQVELERELATLTDRSTPEELESLAARYPVATRTPELLVRAASGHRAGGHRLAAAASLERASDAAWFLVSVGIPRERAMLGEVVGSHARILAELDRPLSAVHVLQRAASAHGGMQITADGSAIDPGSLVAGLRRVAVSEPRAPIIGSRPVGEVDVLVGWSLVAPALERDVSPAVSHEWAVMVHAATRRLGVFCDLGSGRLQPIWTRRFSSAHPTVLRASPDQFIVLWGDDATIERIDPATGDSLWRTQPLARILPADPQAGVRIFDTPLDGQVRSDDIVAAVNDESLVIAQRDGAAIRFDTKTGRAAWTARLPLTRLYDLALAGERIAFSGASDSSEGLGPPLGDRREPRPAPKPVLVVLDTVTGRPAYDPIHPESDIRWIRSAPGVLVVALVRTIRGLDTATGQPVWDDITGDLATHTAEGWVFDDAVYILSRRRELHRLEASTGVINTIDLSSIDRLTESGEITAGRIGKNIGFGSRQGLFLITPTGDPAGATTLSGRRPYMPALASRDVVALVESSTDELADGRLTIRATLVTADSAKLLRTIAVVVHGEPDVVQARLMDGRLVLTTDSVTQVVPLPAGQGP